MAKPVATSLVIYQLQNHFRFMNVNVHTPGCKTKNLGMIPIFGSMPAEIAEKLATSRLKEFDLDIEKDVVGATTDGAREAIQ